ncbi:MAG TPA: hypothetical protein VF743_03615, partial [Acidimicrobiales bacterium]
MLFLYRPRQTRMPFALPRQRTGQAAYRQELQERFAGRRPAPDAGAPATSNEARATTLVRALRAAVDGDRQALGALLTDDVRV